MQKERTIGTTTLKTPYIGMGTWAIGGGTWWGENDDALSIRTIEEAIDRGIVWFDTAPVYGIGHSENVVGKAIKQNRSRILLSTKCGLEWDHETPCFHKVMEGRNVYRDMRKGALNQAIKEMGCNKIAYAHHKDDIIETMLLSLIFEGRFYSFSPKTYLDRTDLTVIRPMMFVDEKDVIGFKNKYQLPVVKSKCPVDGYTKRQYVKELLRQLNHENPGVRERMFHAILDGNIEGWPERIIHPRA